MIELHISPGYSWSVWETKGGLQPTVESLNIPPSFTKRFEKWESKMGRYKSEYPDDEYKKYEAEGRDIALELQRAVGEQFHVIFRYWEAFDPKRWKTKWREEDLFTGKSKDEFWLHEDLPENLVNRVVRIYPDYCSAYLWDLDGCCTCNDEALPYSDDLDARFSAWADRWDAAHDIGKRNLDKNQLAAEKFDDQGIALAAELKRALGAGVRVIYYCTLSDAILEVLKDGKTIECPPDTDFRQWALDNSNNARQHFE